MLHMNTQHNTVPRAAYSLDEAAQSLGLSRRTLYQLMDAGRLSTVKLGKRRLVPAQELERLLRPAGAAA
jgi:excisionase family DNA binding protein